MNPLERIIKYKLTPDEASAYKLALLWEKLVKKFMPKEQFRLAGSRQDYSAGDPRKTYLFKLCWKLQRETRGILKPEEYKYYLFAQIDTLNKISNSNKHARIDANAIVGSHAWTRWKLWQKDFNKRISYKEVPIDENQVLDELKKVKNFLVAYFGRMPLYDDYNNDLLISWLESGNITPTYVLLSPYIQKLVNNTFSHLGFDPKLYESRLTGSVHDFFQKEFSYEFEDFN